MKDLYFVFLIFQGKPNLSDDLPGFSLPNPVKEEKFGDILEERGRKKNKKGGGFQVMGLSFPVLKGIIKRGYKVPTPIQRKVRVPYHHDQLLAITDFILF